MNRKKIIISHCIIGNGYTAKFASYFLKKKGLNAVIISNKNTDTSFIESIINSDISPIPIFPVLESSLFNLLDFKKKIPIKTISVEYTDVTNFTFPSTKIKKKSLGEFMLNNSSTEKWFSLSLKQWGLSILDKPFLEVQKKIDRHYISNNGNSRIGYHNGQSLYYHFIKQHNFKTIVCDSILKIDKEKRVIYTDTHEISYNKLISTIPISSLFKYTNTPHNPFNFVGSYFYYYSYSSGFKSNKMLYDCDFESDILRLYSITDNLLLVQLPSHKKGQVSKNKTSKRIKNLIPSIKELKFEKELFFSMSYPIESIDEKTLIEIDLLKKKNIIPFGRFGLWEYKDLHELNWNDIL